jgi:alanyl-tRNA synthetase
VDTIKNILDFICEKAGVLYGEGDEDVSIRVITDHIRGTVMMVADGILPSNEGRGYVLRRLLRRAARHGRLLGIEGPFLHDVAKVVIRESCEAYPELAEKEDYICRVIKTEEDRFAATIDQGIAILNAMIAELRLEGKDVLPGSMAFKLHDTYGFPLDLTREIAGESGLTVDEEGFRAEMEEQKNKARMALKNRDMSAWGQDLAAGIDMDLKTEFTGYESYTSESKILHIILGNEQVESAQQGEEVTIILDRTPFYAESGGQVADTGVITGNKGKVRVTGCIKAGEGMYLHSGVVEEGIIEKGALVTAEIDVERRLAIARNHTVTHLLHKALRNVLGDHVTQAGSLVEPDRLRFDFRHFSAMTKEDIKRVEEEVNARILEDLEVAVREMSVEEANKIGAMALFGEKYGDIVRVVQAGDYSTELCGGTHLESTAQAGLFKIVSEGGVAAGVRRIEALTGKGALRYYDNVEEQLENIASVLKTSPQESLKRVETISAELKAALKEIEQLKAKLASSSFDEVLAGAVDADGISIATARFDQLDMDSLRNTCENLRNRIGTGVVVLGSAFGGKVSFVAMATKDAVARGIHCGNIVREAAAAAGGGGGGRPDMAQAGGKDTSKIDEALRLAVEAAKAQVK